jgi:hypothetical protein
LEIFLVFTQGIEVPHGQPFGQQLPGEGHQSDDDEMVYPAGDEAEGSGVNRDPDEVEGESAPSYEIAMEESPVHV